MPFLALPRLRFKRSKNKVEIEPEEVKVEKEDVLEINVLNLTRKPSVNRSRVSTVHKVYNRLKPDDPDKLVDVEPEEGSNYEFSVAQVAEFRKVFDSFDRNGDESIGVEELGSVLRALGYSPSESDIEKVLSRFDADASGDLSFDEYLALMAVWVEEDETQILEAFKVFDKSGDGFVSISELKRALCRFGEKFTDDEAEEFFELIDANRDGIINYEEFVKYMLSELNRGPPPRAVT